MRIDVKHLRGFLAVAEELNFTHAAQRLAVAQPALTQWIQFLETEVGVPLFVRTTRRVTLTPAGEALRKDASDILTRLEQAISRTRVIGMTDEHGSSLRIGCVGSAVRTIMPGFARAMTAEQPGITLRVEERTNAELQEALRLGELDLIVTRGRPQRAGWRTLCLNRTAGLVIVAPDHRYSGRKSIMLGELRAERFVLSREAAAPEFTRQTLRACQKAGFSPVVSQYADQMPSMIDHVAAGLGVAIITDDMRKAAERAGCHTLRLSGSRIESLVWAAVREPATPIQLMAMQMLASSGSTSATS
jgi:DNA-binding transcriptional LysR family regulator